jgi:glycosyltransferase involved in cell wall biosynthesis
MRIALVISGGLHPSGREQVIPSLLGLVERLARNHEVHAFAVRHLREPAVYRLRGATVHDLGRPGSFGKKWFALSRSLAANGPFDVIHGMWVDPCGLLAALAGRRFGVPVVVTCDSGEFVSLPEIDYGLQRTLKGRAVTFVATRLATAVHVTSAAMARQATDRGVRAVRIPFGVAIERSQEPRLRADGPPWRLLQVATLSRVKDQGTLLKAVSQVRRTHDVHLDLIGEDTLGGQLQQEVARLGLSDVITVHGFLPHADLVRFHRAAHLYVQSSLHEAAGVAVLEAAAAGVPVVGTRVGFVADWDGAAALAVPAGEPAQLAGAIVQLLENPQRRYAIAHVAREWAERHDADYTAREMADLYSSLR